MTRFRESRQRGSAANPQGGPFGERPIRAGEGSRKRGAARFGGRGLALAAIGTTAGLYSGLFGVGGGAVIVPLLVLWLGFAAGAVCGLVDIGKGGLIGIPAVGGVIAGTALQQRISTRTISLLFAAMLVVVAGDLLLA